MKTDSVAYWKEKKEKLLRKYNNLSEKDLRYEEGKEKEMLESLVSKLGISRQELLKIIIML
jgi:hypothetical protein